MCRSGPRTLIVPIFLQLLLHSLSVKCTRKKSDLFRIWRSPLEIGFTPAPNSYFQLFNTFLEIDILLKKIFIESTFAEGWRQKVSNWKRQAIKDDRSQISLTKQNRGIRKMDAVWLGFSSKNYKMNCASKNWQPIAEINMGKNIEAISSWCGRLATLPKCNDQHCQRTNPPFLWIPSCSSDGKKEKFTPEL